MAAGTLKLQANHTAQLNQGIHVTAGTLSTIPTI